MIYLVNIILVFDTGAFDKMSFQEHIVQKKESR